MIQPELFSQRVSGSQIQVPHLQTVFTIGFGGLDARTFFELLKNAGVTALIDTRRSPSGPRARFADGRDLPYLCDLHNIAYSHNIELAPTRESRNRLKVVEGDKKRNQDDRAEAWTRFLEGYVGQISQTKVLRPGSDLRSVVESAHERVAIACACAYHMDCHRRAAAGLIQYWVKGVDVIHLSRESLGLAKVSPKSPRRYQIRGIERAMLKTNPPGKRTSR